MAADAQLLWRSGQFCIGNQKYLKLNHDSSGQIDENIGQTIVEIDFAAINKNWENRIVTKPNFKANSW